MGRTQAWQEIRVCKAIRLLAEGWEPAKVAQVIKVRRGTLTAWMNNDDFKTQLDSLRELGRIKTEGTWDSVRQEAIQALRRTLRDQDSAMVVRAARELLEQAQQEIERQEEQKRRLSARQQLVDMDGNPITLPAPWAERNPVGTVPENEDGG